MCGWYSTRAVDANSFSHLGNRMYLVFKPLQFFVTPCSLRIWFYLLSCLIFVSLKARAHPLNVFPHHTNLITMQSYQGIFAPTQHETDVEASLASPRLRTSEPRFGTAKSTRSALSNQRAEELGAPTDSKLV